MGQQGAVHVQQQRQHRTPPATAESTAKHSTVAGNVSNALAVLYQQHHC
jgi:hypothetical protein